MTDELRRRIRSAWDGRVSGCQLGKPVEPLSMREGHGVLTDHLGRTGALPPAEPDDDINY